MSEKNGSPEFNFRKMGYRDEAKLSVLSLKMNHLEKRINALGANGDIESLIKEMEDFERESLHLMVKLISYLPDDYLIEGANESEIDYSDPEKIMDVVNWGAMTQLGLDIRSARSSFKKKS